MRRASRRLNVAEAYDLWWSTTIPDQPTLLPSYVELTETFFREVTTRPVPLSLDALRALRGSPMRLDIYAWLTHRMSYLRQPTKVTWDQLMFQFGSNAATARSRRKFKHDFLGHLARVHAVYPARVSETDGGLLLKPSRPHVSRGHRPALTAAAEADPQPAVQATQQYCAHGGEAGTLPNGKPRCPKCRQRSQNR